MLTPKRNNRVQDLKSLVRQNTRLARSQWPGEIGPRSLCVLKSLTREFGLSLASGEILLLNNSWYVPAAGLLRLARGNRCCGIHVHAVSKLCDAESGRWVFKATVYKSPHSKGFVGYGDADPSNVSALVHGAEMRVAETRAVNRALRKAYGIGLCSVEEIGSFPIGNRGHLPPAISGAGLFSPSPIELGLPCEQSHSAPLGSAFEFAPSRPSVPSERRGGFSLSSSPCACPNLIPSPGAKSRKPLTLLSP